MKRIVIMQKFKIVTKDSPNCKKSCKITPSNAKQKSAHQIERKEHRPKVKRTLPLILKVFPKRRICFLRLLRQRSDWRSIKVYRSRTDLSFSYRINQTPVSTWLNSCRSFQNSHYKNRKTLFDNTK